MIEQFGNQLRTLRKAKNYTTQELADKVNVSQSYISRFENGKAIPDIEMLDKILSALDSNFVTFFTAIQHGFSDDMFLLIETVKSLSPEARTKLHEFLTLIYEND